MLGRTLGKLEGSAGKVLGSWKGGVVVVPASGGVVPASVAGRGPGGVAVVAGVAGNGGGGTGRGGA